MVGCAFGKGMFFELVEEIDTITTLEGIALEFDPGDIEKAGKIIQYMSTGVEIGTRGKNRRNSN